MILRVKVPSADSAFRAGYVTKWHVGEGQSIAFGAPICSVAIDEFTALQRTKRAALLGSTSKWRRRKIRDGYDNREGRGLVHMVLRSAEAGASLHEVVVAEGERIDVGDVVGMISVDGVEGSGGEPVDARISVDMPDASDLDDLLSD